MNLMWLCYGTLRNRRDHEGPSRAGKCMGGIQIELGGAGRSIGSSLSRFDKLSKQLTWKININLSHFVNTDCEYL